MSRSITLTALALALLLAASVQAGSGLGLLGVDGAAQLGSLAPAEGRVATGKPYIPAHDASTYTLAVLADTHVRNGNHGHVERALDVIDGIPGIDAAAVLGDLVEKAGTPAELARAAATLKRLRTDLIPIPGNHDYRYESDGKGDKRIASPSIQKANLERFRTTFGLSSLRQYRLVAGHLLVFLPTDALGAKNLVTMSSATVTWFADLLEQHKAVPTVVFYHAPLKGSFTVGEGHLSEANSCAQPAGRIADILKANPQVCLWVAGHRHSRPSTHYRTVGRVQGLGCPTVSDDDAFVRVLEFSAGHIRIRTIDAADGHYIAGLDTRIDHDAQVDDPANAALPTRVPGPIVWLFEHITRLPWATR